MGFSISKKFHSKNLHKARDVLNSARTKFEHKIEKHRRLNRGYLYSKNLTKNLTFKLVSHVSKLLRGKYLSNGLNGDPLYGDELLQQTQTLTRNDFKEMYDDINFKGGIDFDKVNQPNLAQSIHHGKRIFTFANDHETISLDGLTGKAVRNKGSMNISSERLFEPQNSMKELSAAAKYLMDILECNKNDYQDTSTKNILEKTEEFKYTDDNDKEESIIILTDDITSSSDEQDDSIEHENDNAYLQNSESSEDNVVVLSNELSSQSDEEIELSSDGNEIESDHIEEEVGDSDSECASETSILRKEESLMINDIENQELLPEKEAEGFSFDFPFGEHIGNYKKPDVIDLAKYESYVNDYTF